ncbi:unnamed protein product [Closterium sp. Naga37s-1]|nr:unnamed protein product [Closterium sp. Naga37s-1]CAI5528071.1 unnamed protein product [Closterium sp. Naga37s-1]
MASFAASSAGDNTLDSPAPSLAEPSAAAAAASAPVGADVPPCLAPVPPLLWRPLGVPPSSSNEISSYLLRADLCLRLPRMLRVMEVDALALVATALAEASPGGVPGRQVPALLRAASALAGRGASSRLSRGRRGQQHRSRSATVSMAAGKNEPTPAPATAAISGATSTSSPVPGSAASPSAGHTGAAISSSASGPGTADDAAAADQLCAGSPSSATASSVLRLDCSASSASGLHACLVRRKVKCPPLAAGERELAAAAADEVLESLPQLGLDMGSPGIAAGPGPAAVRRLAACAQQGPFGLLPAAASVLRWLDGRLVWLLVE